MTRYQAACSHRGEWGVYDTRVGDFVFCEMYGRDLRAAQAAALRYDRRWIELCAARAAGLPVAGEGCER